MSPALWLSRRRSAAGAAPAERGTHTEASGPWGAAPVIEVRSLTKMYRHRDTAVHDSGPQDSDNKTSGGYGCSCLLMLAIAVVVGVAIWAHGGNVTPAPTPAAIPTPPLTSSAFADAVRSQAPDLAPIPDNTLDSAGQSVCIDADHGTPVSTTAGRLTSNFSAQDAGVIIDLAAEAFCPSQEAAISAAAKSLG
jgi:hypothetical protein